LEHAHALEVAQDLVTLDVDERGGAVVLDVFDGGEQTGDLPGSVGGSARGASRRNGWTTSVRSTRHSLQRAHRTPGIGEPCASGTTRRVAAADADRRLLRQRGQTLVSAC
jgi:hypothetical protein